MTRNPVLAQPSPTLKDWTATAASSSGIGGAGRWNSGSWTGGSGSWRRGISSCGVPSSTQFRVHLHRLVAKTYGQLLPDALDRTRQALDGFVATAAEAAAR